VACAASGDAAAARRALARARRVAGPKLKRRFTPGSNPLVDYRTSLLGAAARLREAREGVRAPSEREIAETSRAENLLERSDVPEELHEVVPLVERWGLGDEPSREYFVRRATRAEKKELRRALRRHEPRIVEWIDSLGAAHTQASTAFLYFLDACEELGVRPRG
jgi:hypothetical protein